MFLSFIVFFLIFSLLILIHELGHLLVAKKSGVRVDEFGFGFPPKLFGKKIKGTLYSINLIPFGGFVRIPGSEYEEGNKKDKGNFANKKPSTKFFILTGGIFMNLFLAIVLYYGLFIVTNFTSLPLFLMDDFSFRYGETKVTQNVIVYSQNNIFKPGDHILQIRQDNNSNIAIAPQNPEEVINFIADKNDKNLIFKVQNVQDSIIREVTAKTRYEESLGRFVVGIGLGESVNISYSRPLEKILSPFLHSYNIFSYSGSIFKTLIKASIETHSAEPVAGTLTGPVGIFFIVEALIKIGGVSALMAIIDFTALLSLSLAIMNILPFPGLDGGHLVFVGYEVIFKKTPPLKFMRITSSAGMAFLVVLAIFIAFKDFFMFR
ncbi:MAG: site-2 protease family protein [Patescibacteria group bacterium]